MEERAASEEASASPSSSSAAASVNSGAAFPGLDVSGSAQDFSQMVERAEHVEEEEWNEGRIPPGEEVSRILIYSHSLPPWVDGVSTRFTAHLKLLKQYGHRYVCCFWAWLITTPPSPPIPRTNLRTNLLLLSGRTFARSRKSSTPTCGGRWTPWTT